MSKNAWQRTGAFVGTVVIGTAIAKTMSPRPSTRAIEAFGKSFSNSLGITQVQKGGRGSVNIQSTGDIIIDGRTTNIFPRVTSTSPVPYFWAGIYYRTLSLFPQIMTPYNVDWRRWVEVVFGEEWEDCSLDWIGIEHFGKLIGELRESYEYG